MEYVEHIEDKQWKSGSDVLALFRAQPPAKTLTRINLQGRIDFENKPIEEIEYAFRGANLNINLRREVQGSWTPPSEDPFYKAKWAFYKSLFSTGE